MEKFTTTVWPDDVDAQGHTKVVHNLGTEDIVVQFWYRDKWAPVPFEGLTFVTLDENTLLVWQDGGGNINGIRIVIIG